jgi:hypothetical protein
MLSVIMLIVIMLIVVMLSVVGLSGDVLSNTQLGFFKKWATKPVSKDCEVSKSAFILASVVIELLEFFEFSPHQSSKTHPNSILPTGNHNTQHNDI